MHYTIDGNDNAWVDLNMSQCTTIDNRMVFQTGGASLVTATIDISNLSPGKHTLSVYFGAVDNCYDSNNGLNYVATFYKAPLNISGESAITVENVDATYDWTGNVIHPEPVVKRGETILSSTDDYDVTYSEGCIDVGNYNVIITGKSNYTGTKNVPFSISKAGYYLVGTMTNDFKVAQNYKLKENTVTPGEYYIHNVPMTTSTKIKVAYSADGDVITTWFPNQDGDNSNYSPGANGIYSIYFKPNYTGGDDWHYKVLYASKTAETSTVNVALAPTGYGTYYNSVCQLTLPENVVAYTVSDNKPTYVEIANGNDNTNNTVAPGIAVLLYNSTKPASVTLTLTPSTSTSELTNLLHGSDVESTTTGGAPYYKLTYGSIEGHTDIFGWYYGADDGAAFTSPAHKAWLALSLSNPASRGFLDLPDDDATGIATIENRQQNADNVWYDLNGRRINAPKTKGIYVKDGRKLVIK